MHNLPLYMSFWRKHLLIYKETGMGMFELRIYNEGAVKYRWYGNIAQGFIHIKKQKKSENRTVDLQN